MYDIWVSVPAPLSVGSALYTQTGNVLRSAVQPIGGGEGRVVGDWWLGLVDRMSCE
jgi:hypothetical protein